MSKKAWIIPSAVLVTAAALLFATAAHWTGWEGHRPNQETDDAYLRSDLTPLSTRISGTVRKVDVGDYETVKAGQILVELDDDDYRANLDQAKAALAASVASLEDNQAEKKIQDAAIESAQAGIEQAKAAIDSAKAGIEALEPQADRALTELHRQQALLASKAATHQQLEAAIAEQGEASGELDARRADLGRALAALKASEDQLEAAKRQREALNVKDDVYKADIEAKKAAIVVAQVNLAYTRISAPSDGTVGERLVFPGQLVAPGTQVIDLVQSDVWVEANFKETQLTNMRVGAPADIRVDTFPNRVFHGQVAQIAPASGSQFALLPPDNATGNFTKVVQRVPVKVVLFPGQPYLDRLRPGLSSVVTVHSGRTTRQSSGDA